MCWDRFKGDHDSRIQLNSCFVAALLTDVAGGSTRSTQKKRNNRQSRGEQRPKNTNPTQKPKPKPKPKPNNPKTRTETHTPKTHTHNNTHTTVNYFENTHPAAAPLRRAHA